MTGQQPAQQERHLIGGEWVRANAVTANINPADTRDVIGHFADGSAQDVAMAVDAARQALAAWSGASPQVRCDALDSVGQRLLEQQAVLGEQLAREEGKTLAEAIGEVKRAGEIFKYFAGQALRVTGEFGAGLREGTTVEVTREPVGVVGVITPWNFPMVIPAWKIAAALAFGNCVVFKPAELTPASAWSLAQLIATAPGMVPGAFNLVMGRGGVIGEALCANAGVDAITFTGSASVGARIIAAATARHIPAQVEMGGKNPVVVLDDADMPTALEAAVHGAFSLTGQRCTASSRIVVTEGIHDRFVAALTERVTALKVGDGRQPGTQIGPVASQAQLESNLRYVETGRAEGARLVTTVERTRRDVPGYFMGPALFTDASNSMKISREEIFGPVATVIRARDYDDALAIANDTPYGLSAGICTTSLKYAMDFKRRIQAGLVAVNTSTGGGDYHVPFGGYKASSFGPREQGTYAIEFLTQVKTSYTRA